MIKRQIILHLQNIVRTIGDNFLALPFYKEMILTTILKISNNLAV